MENINQKNWIKTPSLAQPGIHGEHSGTPLPSRKAPQGGGVGGRRPGPATTPDPGEQLRARAPQHAQPCPTPPNTAPRVWPPTPRPPHAGRYAVGVSAPTVTNTLYCAGAKTRLVT